MTDTAAGSTHTVSLTILVVDDDDDVLRSISNFLEARGHEVLRATRGERGLDLVRARRVDIVITDVRMPDMDGYEVLKRVRSLQPGIEVIVVTGYGEVQHAVRAMKEGAFDFFTKPVEPDLLSSALERTIRFQQVRRERELYRDRLHRLEGSDTRSLEAIIGESDAIRKVKSQIRQVSEAAGTTVLITGETGTGKELVARAIHSQSDRRDQAFIAVDCSTIPAELAESELYGHRKGSFTGALEDRRGHFELAEGGSLFLDEIGELPVDLQAKLLRTLEERTVRRVGDHRETPVDVRVISATNRDLSESIREGAFREDLFYRLNTFVIELPPLRERRDDIPLIARHFLSRFANELHKPVRDLAPDVLESLTRHEYPGNIRELRNLIERAAILATSDRIELRDLQYDRSHRSDAHASTASNETPRDDLSLARVERETIEEALRRTGGNQSEAARLLDISRDALRRRMANHGLLPNGSP